MAPATEKLTEETLADPATPPNQLISDLISTAQVLHRFSMEGGPGAMNYHEANQKVLQAVQALYREKSRMAGDGIGAKAIEEHIFDRWDNVLAKLAT